MNTPTPQPAPSSKKGLVVALGVVAALLVLIVIVLAAVLVTRPETTNDEDDADTLEDTVDNAIDDLLEEDDTDDSSSNSSNSSSNNVGNTGNGVGNTNNNDRANNQVDVNNNDNNNVNNVENNNDNEEEVEEVVNTTFTITSPSNRSYNEGDITFGASFQNGRAGQFITVTVNSRGGSVSGLGPCQILYTAANKTCTINVPHDIYFSNNNARYRATFILYDVDGSVISTQRQDFSVRN